MIISIIGPSLSGKDILADKIESNWQDRCVVFRPGRECRERFGAAMMAKSANPCVPEEVEPYVLSRLKKSEADAYARRIPLVLVGVPKTVEQAGIIMNYCQRWQYPLLVVRLDVSPAEQERRIESRDGINADDLLLARVRMGRDFRMMEEITNFLREQAGVMILAIPQDTFVTNINNELFIGSAPKGR